MRILIFMKPVLLLLAVLLHTLSTNAQTDTLTGGIVVDEKGEGLPGVSIYFIRASDTAAFRKRGATGRSETITDVDGKFDFTSAQQKNPVQYIVVRALGYSQQVVIPGTKRITLEREEEMLVEPQIIQAYKPAIYLYPTHETTVTVKHVFKGTIGTTYPAYNDGWEVVATPDGSLRNTKDSRSYEYLFWEGKYRFPDEHFKYTTGFVVKKAATQEFLWEKLALIGLNNKEINDFVVYWLPHLEQNEANFIHFWINDDIDHSSTLTVSPGPDSRIRLYMEFKAVEPGFTIPPQVLQSLPRKGFTLVEWGGAILGNGPLSIQ